MRWALLGLISVITDWSVGDAKEFAAVGSWPRSATGWTLLGSTDASMSPEIDSVAVGPEGFSSCASGSAINTVG